MSSYKRTHSQSQKVRSHKSGAMGVHRQPVFTMRNGYYLIDARDHFLGYVPSHLLDVIDEVEAERSRAIATTKSIFAFMADNAACALYGLLYRQMRSTGGTVVVPLFHETSVLRRHIDLTLTVLPSGAILHRCMTTRTEPRYGKKPIPALTETHMTACSWCNSLKQGDQWLPIDHLACYGRLFQHPILPQLTHGICPTCYNTLLTSMCDDVEHQRYVN
jgi:hypothetical protein